MKTSVTFTIPMTPRGQGRPRFGVIHGHGRAFKHAKDIGHEQTLAALCAQYRPAGPPLDEPLSVYVVAVFARPKGLCKVGKKTGKPLADPGRRLHTGRPDLDNVCKTVLDALRHWWRDDSLICELGAEKFVASLEEAPHYKVTVAWALAQRSHR
jgi:Holliday junction resolvase RusA-like endonuclease